MDVELAGGDAELADSALRALEFSLEFADVNGDQEIEAPAKARPSPTVPARRM